MRKLLVVAACTMASLAAVAQGTLNFSNLPGTVSPAGAPIFNVDGTTKLAGAGYLCAIYAGPSAGSLVAIGATLPFRTGAGAGFLDTSSGSARTVPTVAPGGTAFVQVKAWDSTFATYDAALAAGGKYGASSVFQVVTGGSGTPPSLPSNLVGLTSFNLVPEPATYALLALGAGALLIRRRK